MEISPFVVYTLKQTRTLESCKVAAFSGQKLDFSEGSNISRVVENENVQTLANKIRHIRWALITTTTTKLVETLDANYSVSVIFCLCHHVSSLKTNLQNRIEWAWRRAAGMHSCSYADNCWQRNKTHEKEKSIQLKMMENIKACRCLNNENYFKEGNISVIICNYCIYLSTLKKNISKER